MALDPRFPSSRFQPDRRAFVMDSARSGAAVTVMTLGSGTLTGLCLSSPAEAAGQATGEDLLHALGSRLAVEVQSRIGTPGAGYSVHFVDTAGPSSAGLREGLREALASHGLAYEEVKGDAMGTLARITVRNLDNGRHISLDLLPESLSQISLIEERTLDPVARRHLLNQAASETLFRALSA